MGICKALAFAATLLGAQSALLASNADALAIDAGILARHMPFGTILDPIYASSTSTAIAGYTRCGDSALWTGAYLAAESFRYNVTQSADALNNVKAALAGLKSLVDVTGDNRLARCIVAADSPYAAGIAQEEAANTIHQNPPWIWVDNTSRDQVVGLFFGLGAAYDLVNDSGVQASVSDLATRVSGFIAGHLWTPNNDVSNTFLVRPEELDMLVQVARHVNPSNTISAPLFVPPVSLGVSIDVLSLSSYFKFNLDYMTFYNLIRLQDNSDNRGAYQTVRSATASHRNAFFNMIDRVLNGPDAARDAETLGLLNDWLQRPRRDFYVDLSKTVAVCGSEACSPAPVALRSPADFLWQIDPFQLSGGGSGLIENAGVDYILPYWMARYYGVITDTGDAQSAAAPVGEVAADSAASLYGTNLASSEAQALVQPLPESLGGASVTLTDSAGVARTAPLFYASPSQINFLVPDGTAAGVATATVANGASTQTFQVAVQTVAPTLFTLNGTGSGVAAATALQVQAGNPQLQSPVPVFQCGASGCSAAPIALGVDTPVFLSLYGTGIRGRSSLARVTVTIDGVTAPALYAGPAPGYTGLDQVNRGTISQSARQRDLQRYCNGGRTHLERGHHRYSMRFDGSARSTAGNRQKVPAGPRTVESPAHYPDVTIGPMTKVNAMVRSRHELRRRLGCDVAGRRRYLPDRVPAPPPRALRLHGPHDSQLATPHPGGNRDGGGGPAEPAAIRRAR
jgi:uncharacterized protein (TIGR03437 family)